MPKPWILAAACSALALPGCVAQRAEAVARAQAPAGDGTAVTSTCLITDASSVRMATPGVGAKPVVGNRVVGKPVNATCPVMLGNPVDPKVTAEWKGATVAFCDVSARATWTADPSRYAGNLPRLSGSGSDLAPVAPVARRRTPSAARVVAAIPKAPTADAAIGSPDAAPATVVAPLASRTAPAGVLPVAALGSPDGAPLVLPAPRPVTALTVPAAKPGAKPGPMPAKAAIKLPGKVPAAAPSTSLIPLHDEHGDDEECPGGVCRVPGM